MSYVKIRNGDFVYFMREELLENVDFSRHMQVMQNADYAVNVRENQLVKCRASIEDVISAAVIGIQAQEHPVSECPVLRGQADAWKSVFAALTHVMPEWISYGDTGEQAAINAIMKLKINATR